MGSNRSALGLAGALLAGALAPAALLGAGQNAPDYLLIGNAEGGFTTQTIPETTVGGGTRAYPIDYTKDGLTSFLVLKRQGSQYRSGSTTHATAHA
jgi:hypothetical protein